MKIQVTGSAGPHGWPADDCRCASCSRLRAAGERFAPTRVLLDGVPLRECAARPVAGDGLDVTAPGGGRVLYALGPGARPRPHGGTIYDAVLLDLLGAPEHLGLLRRSGAVTATTQVMAVHVDHRVPSPDELHRRLAHWIHPPAGPHRTLLLGGIRSGKSAEAELRLAALPEVRYVATGPVPVGEDVPEDGTEDMPEESSISAETAGDAVDAAERAWAVRVRAHRLRRPGWWRTEETTDLAAVLSEAPVRNEAGVVREASGALLIDGIGTWLTAVLDACSAWEEPSRARPRIEELVAAWRDTRAVVVAVSEEVGLSLVPMNRAARVFTDLLGELNQRLAAESEQAALVVAGRVMELPA